MIRVKMGWNLRSRDDGLIDMGDSIEGWSS